ncbi:unnamed protein product [marine sediment metagenome]|uniref:Uncharacterized protein n=1 Tax=marine sediment metagenome TaxID=412755 RepID=X1VB95_9ZZZZ
MGGKSAGDSPKLYKLKRKIIVIPLSLVPLVRSLVLLGTAEIKKPFLSPYIV